jgi:Raf kinase inhibitor-like YbhB/YbcL family protein
MHLTSTAFKRNGMIPARYTQDGESISPDLSWSELPEKTVELAIVLEDPDAPQPRPFVHWVAYGIDPKLGGVPEDSVGEGLEGLATNGDLGYVGPDPPADGGPHRYRFRLYALDKHSGLPAGATRDELMDKIRDHILGEAVLVGQYKRELGDTEE